MALKVMEKEIEVDGWRARENIRGELREGKIRILVLIISYL